VNDRLLPTEAALQQRAIATITPLLPTDARERVQRAINGYNRILRNQVREETGLNLADPSGRGSVPVRVKDGFPAGVAQLIDNYRDPALWLLITLRPALEATSDGLDMLLQQWDNLMQWKHLPVSADSGELIYQSLIVVQRLEAIAAVDDVFQKVSEIHEDILGVYWFSARSPRIEIFWMAQALFAAAFGVGIEDLTAVTLCHELAHAYTHLGRDIDGAVWCHPGFGSTDKDVVEGLAQHITAVVTENVGTRIPGAARAYRELLKHQSGPYRAHETWFPERQTRRSEVVRFAMLRARQRGRVTDPEWRELLGQAAGDLTG
jgi:hypothetical protein